MLIAPTLTKDEFSKLHNALCSLDSVHASLEGVIDPRIVLRLTNAIQSARDALRRSYDLEHETFRTRSQAADALGRANGLKSIWSLHEVEDFTAIPFPHANRLQYEDLSRPISPNASWLDLWVGADLLMKASDDTHHCFIESFTLQPNGKTVSLSTGS